jgi:hypothetical protein
VLPKPALVDAFGGFLTSVSAAYAAEKQKKDGMGRAEIKARLWPLIFVVNELLHTTKFHIRDRQQYDDCLPTLRLPVINLVKDLSQFKRATNPKHFRRLFALLSFWHKQGYFDKNYIDSLRVLVESEGQILPAESKEFAITKQKRENGEADAPRKRKKLDPTKGIQILGGIDNVGEDGDWKLPEWHGGENTPWHLLPAASWLRPLQITDHDRGEGMRKKDFRAIKFKGDTVSKQVRKEVLKLLKQADEIYNPTPDTGKRIEYDQMGRKMEVIKVRKGADGKVKKYIRYACSPRTLKNALNGSTGSTHTTGGHQNSCTKCTTTPRKASLPRSANLHLAAPQSAHHHHHEGLPRHNQLEIHHVTYLPSTSCLHLQSQHRTTRHYLHHKAPHTASHHHHLLNSCSKVMERHLLHLLGLCNKADNSRSSMAMRRRLLHGPCSTHHRRCHRICKDKMGGPRDIHLLRLRLRLLHLRTVSTILATEEDMEEVVVIEVIVEAGAAIGEEVTERHEFFHTALTIASMSRWQ